jgi:hypothetical protein
MVSDAICRISWAFLNSSINNIIPHHEMITDMPGLLLDSFHIKIRGA